MAKKKEYKKCSFCEKDNIDTDIRYNKEHDKFVCPKHRSQLERYGKIFEKTYRDLNEIIISENFAEIILYDDNRNEPKERARVVIDIKDVEKVKDYKWSLSGNGYVTNSRLGLLHLFLKGSKEGLTVDHKDINPLNNRQENLRFASMSQQAHNQNKEKNTINKYIGVSLHHGKWCPQIKKDGVLYRLGRFINEEDAALVYNQKAIKLFGEFAKLNIINKEVI